MKTRLIILFLALLLTISPQCMHAGYNYLAGEWVSAVRSKGGLGASKYYKEDGAVIVAYGVLVDYKYKIIGNVLRLYNQRGELSSDCSSKSAIQNCRRQIH